MFDTENTGQLKFQWSICLKLLGRAEDEKRKRSVKKARIIPPPAAETVKYLPATNFLSPEKLHVLMSKRPLLADI